MKKILFFLLALSFFTAVFLPKKALACTGHNCTHKKEITYIQGKVKDLDNKPLNGALVEAICHHADGDHTKSTHTGLLGRYLVEFPQTQCEAGDRATVIAQKDGIIGSNTGIVRDFLETCKLDLDIAIINVVVPEFGLVAGGFAALVSTGSFLAIKRRFRINK